MKILISIGYKKRELEYISILSVFLEAAGFEVKVQYSNFELFHTIFAWQPDILLLGQVNQPENIAVAEYAHQSGVRVAVLNCEGTYAVDQPIMRFGKKVDHFLDLLLAWGEQHAMDAPKHSDTNPKKIVITGTPKFDFYKKPLLSHFKKKKYYHKQLQPRKKTICVATSLASADVTWEQIKHVPASQKLGKKKSEARIQCQKDLRDAFIELARTLDQSKQYNLIFRIHPLENSTYYRNKFHGTNIIFDSTAKPIELLSSVDLLIHRTSTLACEAWMSAVPTLTFDPIFNRDKELSEIVTFEPVYHQQTKLVADLQKVIPQIKPALQKKQAQYLYRWFGFERTGKELAAQKVTRALLSLQPQAKRHLYHPNLVVYWALNTVRQLLGKAYSYQVIGLFKGQEYLKNMDELIIKPQEVRRKVNQYRHLLKSQL